METTAIKQKIDNVAKLLMQFIERTYAQHWTVFLPSVIDNSECTKKINTIPSFIFTEDYLYIHTTDCHVKLEQSVVLRLRQKAVSDSHHSGDTLVLCKSILRGNQFPAITNYFQTPQGQSPSCESGANHQNFPFLQKLSILFWFTASCLFTGGLGVMSDEG